MKFKKKDVILALSLVGAMAVTGLATMSLPIAVAVGVQLTVLVALLACLNLFLFRVLKDRALNDVLIETKSDYRQVEALLGVYSCVKPRLPLPEFRNWVISPDFARILVQLVKTRRPRVVLEASSGVSTLLIGYLLEEIGSGRVISMDHDAEFAARTRELVRMHGLEHVAEVVHVPLASQEVEGEGCDWYDYQSVPNLKDIDMMVVDGPPCGRNPMARYPALPLIHSLLSPSAVVVIDDAGRAGERLMLEKWQGIVPACEVEELATEKGAALVWPFGR